MPAWEDLHGTIVVPVRRAEVILLIRRPEPESEPRKMSRPDIHDGCIGRG